MIYLVEILEAAQTDVADAIKWYHSQKSGLGAEFLDETISAVDKITQNPESYRIRHKTKLVRWIYPKRFPYRVIYVVAGDRVKIIAVIHAARHDSSWDERA